MNKEYEEVMLKYGFALSILETELNILFKNNAHKKGYNPIEHVKSRVKSTESAISKLERKDYEVNIDNLVNHIHDMIGVRIVCSFLTDVYEIVELIKKSNHFAIKDEKDYIAVPKETGYISYHLIVMVPVCLDGITEYMEAEIQIRTIAMDFWASLDHKIKYKFSGNVPEDVNNEMYKCAIDIKSLDNKMLLINEAMKKYTD